MDGKLNYHRFVLCMKKHLLDEKCKSVKNRGFSQNSKGGTKANFSKMADFLGKLWKLRKIGNTSRMIA